MQESDKQPPMLNWLCPITEHQSFANSGSYTIVGWQKDDTLENICNHWNEYHSNLPMPLTLSLEAVNPFVSLGS